MPLSSFDATLHNASIMGYDGVLRAVAERIVPADEETPGAADAGAVDYLQQQLAEGGDLRHERRAYEDALLQINDLAEAAHGGAPFPDLTDADKDDILRRFEKQNPRFFARMVEHVQECFYTSQAGLDMVGWKVTG